MIKQGDKIKVEYEGKLESGEIFDSSTHGDHSHPIEFEVGKNQVIKGFENAVLGMELNQEKEIKLAPEEAYGQPNPKLLYKVPKTTLPKDQEPKAGMMLIMTAPSGQQIPAKISEVTENEVTLDLNHPLVGKTLIFKIKVVQIN